MICQQLRDDHSCPYLLESAQEDIDSDGEDDKADSSETKHHHGDNY